MPWLVADFTRRFGSPKMMAGRWFFDRRYQFENGASIMFHEKESRASHNSICVDIPGSVMQQLGWREGVDIALTCLGASLHATRVDVAIDPPMESIESGTSFGIDLQHLAEMSYLQGQLVGARICRVQQSYSDGADSGRTVYFGKRGDAGSGRYVRIYDKGVESGQAPSGAWHRFEVEFSGDVATQVGEMLQDNERADRLAQELAGIAFGSIDFRVDNGARTHKERPRVTWWAKFLDDVECEMLTERRSETRLNTFAAWLERCVCPTLLKLGSQTQDSLADVIGELVDVHNIHISDWNNARPIIFDWLCHRRPDIYCPIDSGVDVYG
jgi:hypothetical protein